MILNEFLSNLIRLSYLKRLRQRLKIRRALTVKNKHCLKLLVHPDVVGMGIGLKTVGNSDTGQVCITIYVPRKLPLSELDSEQILPNKLDGISTDIVEFGMGSKKMRLQASSYLGERMRPVTIGASIGHFALQGAGTLTGYVKDKKTDEILLMSCWHVLTNFGRGKKGDEIIQPALIDGGTVDDDTVATLESWVNVKTLGPILGEAKSNLKSYLNRGKIPPLNKVDVAFAKPISNDVIPKDFSYAKVKRGRVGETASWIGRTSGVTRSKIIDNNATMWVEYPGYGVALFDDVAVSRGKNFPGDSGAPIFVSGR